MGTWFAKGGIFYEDISYIPNKVKKCATEQEQNPLFFRRARAYYSVDSLQLHFTCLPYQSTITGVTTSNYSVDTLQLPLVGSSARTLPPTILLFNTIYYSVDTP